jgi:2-enoate reductase
MGRMIHYKNISCAVNPTCARERYTQLTQALTPRQVLIVGGGPAGMETARVCAERGHKVRLYEAGERLGGNLIPGGVPDFKEDDHALIRWYEEQLSRVGVEIHLNTALDAAAILKQDFDHLVIATGSTPKIIPFGEGAPVVAAEQVLLGEVEVGNDIVIMGGGLVGCETALWLAEAGKQVTVVELLDDVLKLNGPLCPSNFEMLKALLPYKGVRVLTSSSVAGYADGAAIIQTPEGEERVAASAIIECVGYAPVNDLYEELRFEVPSINKLGDSLAVSNIMNAIWAGYELGSSI